MNEIVRIGQVGLGYWGKNLLRNFSNIDGCVVTEICDGDESVLSSVGRRYPGSTARKDFSSMLASDNVDAVVIATDTPQHYPLALQAIAAGKHVFVEKPMAGSTIEAMTLAQEVNSRKRTFMVGHLLLYHPAFLYVQDLIESGELGDVYYLYGVRVNLGIVRSSENAFESLAPHDISVALAFLEAAPIAVSAVGQSYLQPGIEDVVFAVIHFEDGKMAHLHTSWLDPHKVRKVTVVGSRKMAVIDDVEGVEKVRLYDKGVDITPRKATFVDYASAMTVRSGDIRIPKINMQEPLAEECRHFVESIRSGNPPRSDVTNGLEVVRIMDAAMMSLRNGGKRVILADLPDGLT